MDSLRDDERGIGLGVVGVVVVFQPGESVLVRASLGGVCLGGDQVESGADFFLP